MLALPASRLASGSPRPGDDEARAGAGSRRWVGPDRAALALVLLGGAVIAPWFVCGLAIFVLPAWAVAEYIAHRRRKRGLPTSMARRLVWIAVLAIIIPIVTGLALVIAVLLICRFSGPQHFP